MIKIKRGKTPQVGCEIRLCSGQPAKPHELIGAEFIRFEELRPFVVQPDRIGINLPEVGAARPLRSFTNPIFPVVAIREAASWQTNDRNMNLLHNVYQLRTYAVLVCDFRFLSNPHAVVNHAANMFCKLAIDVRRNLPQRFVQKDLDAGVGVSCPDMRAGKNKHSARRTLEKLSPFHCNSLSVRSANCVNIFAPLTKRFRWTYTDV